MSLSIQPIQNAHMAVCRGATPIVSVGYMLVLVDKILRTLHKQVSSAITLGATAALSIAVDSLREVVLPRAPRVRRVTIDLSSLLSPDVIDAIDQGKSAIEVLREVLNVEVAEDPILDEIAKYLIDDLVQKLKIDGVEVEESFREKMYQWYRLAVYLISLQLEKQL